MVSVASVALTSRKPKPDGQGAPARNFTGSIYRASPDAKENRAFTPGGEPDRFSFGLTDSGITARVDCISC